MQLSLNAHLIIYYHAMVLFSSSRHISLSKVLTGLFKNFNLQVINQKSICFTAQRIHFYNDATEAGQPTHSNAFVYLGSQITRFVRVFSAFGVVATQLRAEGAAVIPVVTA